MELFAVSDNEKEEILKFYNTDRAKIERDVKILEEWLKKQPHLPKKFHYEHFLEKILLGNKFRIEKTKEKIDAYFTLKNIHQQLYSIFKTEKYISLSEINTTLIPLPKLGPNKERIILVNYDSNSDLYDFDHFIQLYLMMLEMILHYDYNNGIRVFFDLKNFSVNHLKKLNYVKLSRITNLALEGYSSRIVGITLLNMSPAVSVVITILKSVLKAKIFQRIKVCHNLEAVYEDIPKNLFPRDYGGEQKSIDELRARLDKLFQNDRNFFQVLPDIVSNEALRVGESQYVKSFSELEGTFKQLNVD